MAKKGSVKTRQKKAAKAVLQRKTGNPVTKASLEHQFRGNAAATHQLGIRGQRDRSGARREAIRASSGA